MAVTVTPVSQPSGLPALKNRYVATVAATADADTTATITHNFGLSTSALQSWVDVQLVPLKSNAGISLWYVSAFGANSITLTKATGAGSGVAGDQLQVVVSRPMTANC